MEGEIHNENNGQPNVEDLMRQIEALTLRNQAIDAERLEEV